MLTPKIGEYIFAYSDCEAQIPFANYLIIISFQGNSIICGMNTINGIEIVAINEGAQILRVFENEAQAIRVTKYLKTKIRHNQTKILRLQKDDKDALELLIKGKI